MDGSGREDADAAVAAAERAFGIWRRMSAISRCELLHELADRCKGKMEEIARLMTMEGGKPLKENIDEIGL
jgi:betaine-aldehyde dehydrogenase